LVQIGQAIVQEFVLQLLLGGHGAINLTLEATIPDHQHSS
jgi:hypothetical protein